MLRDSLELFIETHREYFDKNKILLIKHRLKGLSEDRFLILTTIKFKDPIIVFVVSLFFGFFLV